MPASDGRFVRWQTITITQFGFLLNLLLGFAVAALGLWVSLVRDPSFQPQSWARCSLVLSGLSAIASIVSGIWCSMNRLWDFRGTTDIARNVEQWDKDELASNRRQTEKLGKRTWVLFYFQVAGFILAMLLLTSTFVWSYRSKLF